MEVMFLLFFIIFFFKTNITLLVSNYLIGKIIIDIENQTKMIAMMIRLKLEHCGMRWLGI